MLAGHYAGAFLGKAVEPKLPLWLLFVAAQLLDICWGVLILAGVERASLDYSLPSNPLVARGVHALHA